MKLISKLSKSDDKMEAQKEVASLAYHLQSFIALESYYLQYSKKGKREPSEIQSGNTAIPKPKPKLKYLKPIVAQKTK